MANQFKKTIKKRLVKKLKRKRSIQDGRDDDRARGRSGGKAHTSSAAGRTQRQKAGGHASPERKYSNKDPRIIKALKEIRSSHQCGDPTAERICIQRGYARRAGKGLALTPKGADYIRYGKEL